jgi:hypothetical protein
MASSSKRSSNENYKFNVHVHSKKSKSNTTDINHYTGWTVPSPNYQIPSLNIHDITPQQFYQDYIQKRRPIVLRGISSDLSQLYSWKDMQYLQDKAGHQTVKVERRRNHSDGYGQGNEVSMKFSQFLQLLQNNDEFHYLTTQDVHSNNDGRPEILPQFMEALSDDFPIQPSLMGNLIPQNVNLWMGHTNNNASSSSGLHHDYHDNLYIVLRGRKRFRLFSPMDTQHLYTRGSLLQVHTNGRINYVGEETTPYGADLGADAAAEAAKRQVAAEERLHRAETAMEEGRDGAEEELAAAEEELEEAMEALIDAEADDDEDDEECSEVIFDGNSKHLVDKTVKNPNNFSKIPSKLLEDASKSNDEFPNLQKATMAYCTIDAGEMLYLPASWFHEVTSCGGEGEGHHVALNYWYVKYLFSYLCHHLFVCVQFSHYHFVN